MHGLRIASTLEALVNGFISRALLSPDHLEELERGFGGLTVERDIAGRVIDREQLAHAIAAKVLRPGWYWEVVEDFYQGKLRVRIVITGRN